MVAPDFSGVPFDVQERLAARDAKYAAAIARGTAFEAVRTAVETAQGAAVSFQGEVRATVSSRGLLTELHVSARGVALGPRALSRLVTATIREALTNLQENLTNAIEEADPGVAGASVLSEMRAGLVGPLSLLDAEGPVQGLR
ncbi:hypothetical protein MTE01_11160 [Microbacterium testaceum]|uniref:YbaB/EbfC DNA-binding family protein n=1 Tax=Microbacterium testaceum TaxID=2033 RepID=A0A4Y3QIY2_MICTE|nr:hypothetical protein MTE01_11160 [Microbacterium testaceum]